MISYPVTYHAKYRDKFGEEITTIESDGKSLSLKLRGMTFSGTSFDWFEPDGEVVSSFTGNIDGKYHTLAEYSLEVDIPVIVLADQPVRATLHMNMVPGRAIEDFYSLPPFLTLAWEGHQYDSVPADRRKYRDDIDAFDIALYHIHKAMPEGWHVKCCYSCALGTHNPYGGGMMGDYVCFRGNKAEFLKTRGKSDVLRIWDTLTEYVQETYLCPEYE